MTISESKFDSIMHGIAQGVINVSEGLTEIQPHSLIHNAMAALCEAVSANEIGTIDSFTLEYQDSIKYGIAKHLLEELHELGLFPIAQIRASDSKQEIYLYFKTV